MSVGDDVDHHGQLNQTGGVLAAGLFFSAVYTGGFGMERGASVPRELSQVLQALMILLIAARGSFHFGRGSRGRT